MFSSCSIILAAAAVKEQERRVDSSVYIVGAKAERVVWFIRSYKLAVTSWWQLQ